MKPITLLIVDDHAIVRMGMASLLGTHPDLAVVGEAENGESAVALAKKLRPDVILMDMVMPDIDGAEATRRIRENGSESKILILTSFGSSGRIAHALSAGAAGAVGKTLDDRGLIDAIRRVHAGERVVSEEIAEELDAVARLSPRQDEVLALLAKGLSNGEIAELLGLSRQSVKDHERALYAKLGAANRTEAVAIALRKHLLKI